MPTLEWIGKSKVINHHQDVPFRVLERKYSFDENGQHDEDKELNSLTNQKNILVEYAENNGYTVVGESFDDNVSGMHFNREGIEKIYDEVEKKTIDAVIVKDYCAIIGLNQKDLENQGILA